MEDQVIRLLAALGTVGAILFVAIFLIVRESRKRPRTPYHGIHVPFIRKKAQKSEEENILGKVEPISNPTEKRKCTNCSLEISETICPYCGFNNATNQPATPPRPRSSSSDLSSDLITRPLFAVLALLVLFIIIPVFASISTVGTSASSGLISMSATIAKFTPILGIGLAVGMILMFISLATVLRRSV